MAFVFRKVEGINKMLELHIDDINVSSSVVPVSWCVDKELLKLLASTGIENPQLVICVSPAGHYHKSKEIRYVVPLKDLMTYIEFRSPGKHRVWAFVSTQFRKDARREYLSRLDDILDCDGEEWSSWFWIENKNILKVSRTYIEVEVPDGCFAPDPPQWEKDWINWLWSIDVDNQCEYRRLRIFAYTVQPIVFLINCIIRLLSFAGGLLIGSKSLTLHYLRHPLATDLLDALSNFEGSHFVRTPDPTFLDKGLLGKFFVDVVRTIVYLLFMPILMIMWALLIKFLGLHAVAVIASGLFASIVIALSVIFAGLTIANSAQKNMLKSKNNTTTEFWYLDKIEQDLLVCNGQKKPLKVAELPSKHRTIKLRFIELKSKVCRPFRR